MFGCAIGWTISGFCLNEECIELLFPDRKHSENELRNKNRFCLYFDDRSYRRVGSDQQRENAESR